MLDSESTPQASWRQRVQVAKERGHFHAPHEHRLVGNWRTCACCELDKTIPRVDSTSWEVGKPIDRELVDLGMAFCDAVTLDMPDRAEEILNKIEERAKVLLSVGVP